METGSLGSTFDYTRMTLDLGDRSARSPQGSRVWVSKTRVAVRGYGGLGFPGQRPVLPARRRAGGSGPSTSTQNIGSSVWLGTAEWRFPIWEEANVEALDHILKGRNVYGSLFYDVGQSSLKGHSSPVVNGVGVGLGVDVALFSFLERATIRVDIAEPVGSRRGPVIWFGLNQVF